MCDNSNCYQMLEELPMLGLSSSQHTDWDFWLMDQHAENWVSLFSSILRFSFLLSLLCRLSSLRVWFWRQRLQFGRKILSQAHTCMKLCMRWCEEDLLHNLISAFSWHHFYFSPCFISTCVFLLFTFLFIARLCLFWFLFSVQHFLFSHVWL